VIEEQDQPISNRSSKVFGQGFVVVNESDRELIRKSCDGKIKLPIVAMENQAYYEGEWMNLMRWGWGKQRWADGSEYIGEWVENKA
jgi:hypothetical protein